MQLKYLKDVFNSPGDKELLEDFLDEIKSTLKKTATLDQVKVSQLQSYLEPIGKKLDSSIKENEIRVAESEKRIKVLESQIKKAKERIKELNTKKKDLEAEIKLLKQKIKEWGGAIEQIKTVLGRW